MCFQSQKCEIINLIKPPNSRPPTDISEVHRFRDCVPSYDLMAAVSSTFKHRKRHCIHRNHRHNTCTAHMFQQTNRSVLSIPRICCTTFMCYMSGAEMCVAIEKLHQRALPGERCGERLELGFEFAGFGRRYTNQALYTVAVVLGLAGLPTCWL